QNPDGSWYQSYSAVYQDHACNAPVTPNTSNKWEGDIAWTIFALGRYRALGGTNIQAEPTLQKAADWLETQINPADGCLANPSTEATIDAWQAFQAAGRWDDADKIKNCLLHNYNYWNDAMGRFVGGRDQFHLPYLDNQTWGGAFLKAIGENGKALRALSYARDVFRLPAQGGQLYGFDSTVGPWSIWNEGTATYIAAGGQGANDVLQELLAQQREDGAMPGSPDEFNGGGTWATRWHGVAPTAWLYNALNNEPFVPALLAPVDGAHLNDPTPTLDWGDGQDHYQVQIATASDFNAGSIVRDENVAVSTYTPADALPDGVYYWRVKAFNATGESKGWLFGVRSFTIDTIPPTVSSIVRADANPTNVASVHFTVTFSKPVTCVDTGDFTLYKTISDASITDVTPVSGTTYTVTVNTGTGDGTIRLDTPDTATITDLAGNPLAGLPYTSGEVYTIDKTTPTVISIIRADPNPTNAASVDFTVTFSEPVTGVDTIAPFSDFALTTTGVTGASITNVSPPSPSATYTVIVNTGTGDGTICLNIPVTATITDLAGNPLAGLPYTSGQCYTIGKIAPTVISIVRADPDPTNAANVDFTVTFSKPVTNVDSGDFALTTTGGITGSSVTNVSGGPTIYTVAVNTGTGDGTICLNIPVTATITDLTGNPLAGLPYTSGQCYTIDKTPPTVSSIKLPTPNPTATSVRFTVTFSEPVTGVDTGDFILYKTGAIVGASITGVSGGPTIYTVTVNTGTGDGTIRLDIPVTATITDLAGNPLAGLPYTKGQTFVRKTLIPIGAQDGWVLESGENTGVGGIMNATATTCNLGDDATKKQYRCILSFSTGALPDTAKIISVTLKVKQQAIGGGGNPVTMFQGFMADIKNGTFGTSALQITDFQTAASASYGPFVLAPVGGWYSINLTGGASFINKLATGSGLTQIRLRFKLDDNNNAIANYLSLYSGNAPAASQPQLVITYYVP
ncbi:MAG: Ig-like domain-containing protein, partial [Anaerolineales bacterium]